MKTSFIASFLTLAATSLLFNPSASAVEVLEIEAIAARAEAAETKCSDNGSNIKCPPIRKKDSISARKNIASSQSLSQADIKVDNNQNDEKNCKDKDGSIIVCPTVTNSGGTIGQ